MVQFIQGGPKRFAHQQRGLRKLIETGGVAALLFEPGLGKTATMLDYFSLLALKAPVTVDEHGNDVQEVRVLVAAPLAAVDTWVIQSETFMSPQVNYWAEALGGSLVQRAHALAARGKSPFRDQKVSKRVGLHSMRATHFDKSIAWGARAEGSFAEDTIAPRMGPDALGTAKPRVVLMVMNLDSFSRRDRHKSGTIADLMLDAVKRFNPDMVVVDESHKIKGAGSNVSRLLGRIGETVKRRAILTGTVMPSSPIDVFGQWRFLQPFAFGLRQADGTTRRATFGSFRDRFAIMGGWMGKQIVGYRDLDDMQTIMADNAVVALKKDCLDLPPLTPVIVPVHLSAEEKRAYADMKKSLAVALTNGSMALATNRLAQMMRLRQITAGYLPNDHGIEELGTSKIDTISSIVNDTLAGEKRIVVFTMFVHETQQLKEALAAEGTEVLVIGGGAKQDDRIAKRKRFGSDDPTRLIMLAQVQTLSLAVNELVTACDVVFASLSQRRDDLVQAIDRLNRMGQTRPMTAWFPLAPGSIDEVIYSTHQTKADLEANVIRHILDQEQAAA